MKEGASKKKLRMVFLIIAAVIVLAGVLLYIFVVKPSYSGYAVKLQTQGASQEDVRILYAILTQVNQQDICLFLFLEQIKLSVILMVICSLIFPSYVANINRVLMFLDKFIFLYS